jgi:hypothetical protein
MLAKAGEVEGEASLRAVAEEVLRFVGVEIFGIGSWVMAKGGVVGEDSLLVSTFGGTVSGRGGGIC